MKTIISAMITCAVIFGLSAGATQYLMKQKTVETETTESIEGDDVDPKSQGESELAGEQQTDRPMPVSFRPEANVSVEAVLQMSDSIKRMEQELAEREQRVERDEKRIKLLYDDLATEQDELRAYAQGIDAKLESMIRVKDDLEQTLMVIESQRMDLEKLAKKAETKTPDADQELEDRVNGVKSWFANLAPEQAAEYLREFSNNGKMSFAAALLQKMPDRQKSKILAAMNDPVLVDQLIESLSK